MSVSAAQAPTPEANPRCVSCVLPQTKSGFEFKRARECQLCQQAKLRPPNDDAARAARRERLVKSLNVKLIPMDIDPDYHARKARKLVLPWNRKPMTVIGNLTCAPCMLVNRESHRIAEKYGVNAIAYGGNRYEAFEFSAVQLKDVNLAKKHSMTVQAREALAYAKRGLALMSKSIVRKGVSQRSMACPGGLPWMLSLRGPTLTIRGEPACDEGS